MRGEYDRNYPTCGVFPELPPRARRIRQVRFRNIPNDGTTSACAENTFAWNEFVDSVRNYLRVRGEYIILASCCFVFLELPPRARRIPNQHRKMLLIYGTTSACAENTGRGGEYKKILWNYLRVRGEYESTTTM